MTGTFDFLNNTTTFGFLLSFVCTLYLLYFVRIILVIKRDKSNVEKFEDKYKKSLYQAELKYDKDQK